MRICLVDDEAAHLDYLQSIIKKWSTDQNIDVTISMYHSSEEFLFENNQTYPFDLIILDIQMGKINGIELAKKIRTKDDHTIIAFVSGMANFVFEGYEVQAIRYILKPIKDDKVVELLEYTLSTLKQAKQYIIVSVLGEKRKVYYDDIIFVQSMGHYVVFHLVKEEFDVKYSIHTLSEELSSFDFIRTHRSYIVNLRHIERITRQECILSSDLKVPLSRSAYKFVNEKFISYHMKGDRR